MKRRWPALFALMISVYCGGNVSAAHVLLYDGGGEYKLDENKTWLDKKFKNTIRQRFDFSCGSAALATMLTHHYGFEVDEMTILNNMYTYGDKEKITKEGFSLLDMKNFLSSIGLKSEGYRESLDKLSSVGIPAIALLDTHGYMHFVVIKAVTEDKVLVSDPSRGLQTYNRAEFEGMWNNIIFVILDKMETARYNTQEIKTAWENSHTLNIDRTFADNDLSRLTRDITYTPNYY